MGAKTKFSASESAEAFNYMAMAGWKTEDMLNGIEGIMNLAAASGEDLATTSDIVTDALTAMGYQAGDAGKLADVMAAASSNANTNVSLMGSTFQYAAPIVGALGYSMEDTAVAIGLMANAGIKGDKAGTALRSTLTRLSAPPKECADALDDLGISLTDSEGKMKPFSQVMEDLRGAFDGLSETQQTQYAKAIAGQEAMSGLLAIVNAAPADFEKLTKAVAESNGAAQEMSETMQDNLAGDITLLKSKIEGIMIKVFEKMSDSLRKSVSEISDALDKIDWDAFGEKAGKMAEKLVDWLIKIVDNFDGIVSVLKTVGTVLATVFVVSKILTFASAISSLYSTFKTLKTATDAATTSQLLLNAAQAATPVGLVAAAVAGLAAGVIYLASKNNEAKETTNSLTEAQQEQIDKINEMNQAYADMKAVRDESVSAVEAEYSHYSELSKELDGLVDANGAVKEADQDRANFIISTLNEALGTEIQMIDGVIQNYQDEKSALEDLMATKKAEAVLRANEESYTAAIQGQQEALENYMGAQELYRQKKNELNQLESQSQHLANMSVSEYAAQNDMMWDMGTAANMLANEQEAMAEKVKAAKAALGDSNVALHNAENAYTSYQSTIANYEGLSAAIISGDQQKISDALAKQKYDFQTVETGTRETLENQVKNFEKNYEDMKKAVEDGSEVITQEMVDEAGDMVKKAKAEYNKLPPETEKATKKAGNSAAKGMESTKGANQKAATDVKKTAQNAMKDNGEANKTGKGTGSEYASGVESTKGESKTAGTNIAKEAVKGESSQDESSKTSGKNFGQGFINGIGSLFKSAFDKAKELAKEAVKGIKKGQKEGSPSKITYQSGVYFVQGYINGIVSQQGKLQTTVKNMVGFVVKELANMKNFNFSEVGESASEAFSNALAKKFDYTVNRMSYKNENMLAKFDKSIEKLGTDESKAAKKLQSASDKKVKKLETNRDKKVKSLQAQLDALDSSKKNSTARKKLQSEIKSTKESYNKKIKAEKDSVKKQITKSNNNYKKLIETEKNNKEAYQKASNEMISAYSQAMSEYQTKAQALIDDTINGITERYNERYDELISKQDSLIDKLKSAGNLFEVSGAGIMTINDLQEQTKAIKDYTDKLQKIKAKVSSDLFDEIVSFDMKEGSAFMDRLLAMSASDLDAYNKAYTEKMQAAQQAGESIYKSDFDKIASDYKSEINKAFNNLPKQLEELGDQAMKGFLNGLTTNTDYMSKEIKTYIKAMVDTFKNELQIKSPSKVMMELGDYTGIGFVDGLKDTINSVKKTAQAMAKEVTTPLDDMKTNLGNARSAVKNPNGVGQTTNNVTNNYNLVQNNTSPKALTALETYQARRRQVALVKAMT
jgi:TP901 family phage tail tape measure protein